jgi:N-acetylglucosamine malate deacetylase 1
VSFFTFHPRRWLAGNLSHSRFLGHIWPQLLIGDEAEFIARRQLVRRAWWPKVLTAPLGKRLLVISPHPDDEAIGAGGLLLAHKGKSEIHILSLTNGEGGGALENPPSDPKEELALMAAARREELKRVAAELGSASLEFLSIPVGNISINPENLAKVRAAVERIAPDVVLLPWFLDNHPDHRAANQLYAEACHDMDHLVLGYEIWEMTEPNALFDITPFLEQKMELIRHYVTQLRTVNYLEYAAALARLRAFHGALNADRTGAAEGFVALPNAEYCQLARMLSQPRPSQDNP